MEASRAEERAVRSGAWRTVLSPGGFGGAVCPEPGHQAERGRRITPTATAQLMPTYQVDLKAFAAAKHREDRT